MNLEHVRHTDAVVVKSVMQSQSESVKRLDKDLMISGYFQILSSFMFSGIILNLLVESYTS